MPSIQLISNEILGLQGKAHFQFCQGRRAVWSARLRTQLHPARGNDPQPATTTRRDRSPADGLCPHRQSRADQRLEFLAERLARGVCRTRSPLDRDRSPHRRRLLRHDARAHRRTANSD